VIGKQERWQEDLFVAGPLSSLIPDDHILKRVDVIAAVAITTEGGMTDVPVTDIII